MPQDTWAHPTVGTWFWQITFTAYMFPNNEKGWFNTVHLEHRR